MVVGRTGGPAAGDVAPLNAQLVAVGRPGCRRSCWATQFATGSPFRSAGPARGNGCLRKSLRGTRCGGTCAASLYRMNAPTLARIGSPTTFD